MQQRPSPSYDRGFSDFKIINFGSIKREAAKMFDAKIKFFTQKSEVSTPENQIQK
ncbi:MAG: hypothetical protein V3Q69_10495 [Burkholderia sp.]